jgi:hypothetical protein
VDCDGDKGTAAAAAAGETVMKVTAQSDDD